jgi:hypothetical protein
MDYFREKPDDLEKTTILLDNGYHPQQIQMALEQVYPEIMTNLFCSTASQTSRQYHSRSQMNSIGGVKLIMGVLHNFGGNGFVVLQ